MKRETLFVLVNADENGEIHYRGLFTNLNEAIGEAMQDAADVSEGFRESGDEFKVWLPEWLQSGAGYLIQAKYRKAGWANARREYWHILTGDAEEAAVALRAGEAREKILKSVKMGGTGGAEVAQ